MGAFIATHRTPEDLELELQGDWRASRVPLIDRELEAVDLGGIRRLEVSTEHLASLDLSGSWQLQDFLSRARGAGVDVSIRGPLPDPVALVEKTLGRSAAAAAPAPELGEFSFEEPVRAIGRHVVRRSQATVVGFAFVGRLSLALLRSFGSARRLRPVSIARHVYDTGITAIPIVALIAFLISVIIAYMSAQQLRNFGAQIFVVDLVTIGVLRELGVLLTAIIVAGRSGSAYAAEIGSMRLNEEIDALKATGVDPIEVLIVPRVLGLVIALPLLTIIADAIGLTGGALLCHWLLDMPITQYLARVDESIAPTTFWVGLVKAPVFALLIALAGTYRGMQVRDSSRQLGRLTTLAVVQAIFLVILADALFAVIFMELDI